MAIIVAKSSEAYTGTVKALPTAERILIDGGSDQAPDYQGYSPAPEIDTGWKKKSAPANSAPSRRMLRR